MKIEDIVKSAETRKMELSAGGETTYIEYRSVMSDEFAAARVRHQQALSRIAAAGKPLTVNNVVMGVEMPEPSEECDKLMSILTASLIVSWGFEDELTLESAAKMLHNNKSIRAALDAAASQLARDEDELKKPR